MLRDLLEDGVGAPTREELEAFVAFLEAVQQASEQAFAFDEAATPLDADGVFRMRLKLSTANAMAGVIEPELRRHAPELLQRFAKAAPDALKVIRTTIEILAAAEQNEAGRLRGESLDERLDRSIEQAKRTPPIYVGSFAKYANDDANDSDP
jgi:hypothetical protein